MSSSPELHWHAAPRIPRRPIRGKRLLAIWLGGILGSWVLAYLFARGVIWLAHAVFG